MARRKRGTKKERAMKINEKKEDPFAKQWDGECENCGESPTVAATGMCGPCTFGEADTIGGNW